MKIGYIKLSAEQLNEKYKQRQILELSMNFDSCIKYVEKQWNKADI